jgi:hypothetical protein
MSDDQFLCGFSFNFGSAPTSVHDFSRSRISPISPITSHPNPTGDLDNDSSIDIVVRRVMVPAQRKSRCEKGKAEKMREWEKLCASVGEDLELMEKLR